MFLSGSADRWKWSEDAFEPVALCVRALLLDGLKILPFDQHPDGDGILRAAGLNEAAWREWVETVIRRRTALSEAATALGDDGDRQKLLASAREAATALQSTGSLCPGSLELQRRLNELWNAYQPLGDFWKRQMTMGDNDFRQRLAPREAGWLWNALLPFHDRLATISLFLVDYPVPMVMALPPTTCLIAPGHGPETYSRQVIDAAAQLSAAV